MSFLKATVGLGLSVWGLFGVAVNIEPSWLPVVPGLSQVTPVWAYVETAFSKETKFISHYDLKQIQRTGRLPQSQVPDVVEEIEERLDNVIEEYHASYCNNWDYRDAWAFYEELNDIDCRDYQPAPEAIDPAISQEYHPGTVEGDAYSLCDDSNC